MNKIIGGVIVFALVVAGVSYAVVKNGPVRELTASSGIEGEVFLGPVCPVMQNPPDPQCADQPFKTNLVLSTSDGGQTVKSFNSDASGKFRISVSPGLYLINSPSSGAGMMTSCSKGGAIEVKANAYTKVVINCDSGIR